MSQGLPLGPDGPGPRSPGTTIDEIGLKRPEVPTGLTLDPSELPDDEARAALARMMAEPDPAPTDPAAVGLRAAPPETRPVTVMVRGLPPTADPAVPAPVGPRGSDPALLPLSAATGSDAKPAEGGSVRTPDAAVPAAAAAFDPASLQKALDAYVGAEPMPVGGRVQPQEEARYRERAAIRAVYAARGYAPLWVEDGVFNAKGRSIEVRLDHAAEDGLDLRAFSVMPPKPAEPSTLAASELSLTEAAVAYGKQATGGRVDPARIAALIAAKPDVADAARVIGTLTDAPDAGEALRNLNPPHRGYALLRDKLAEVRRAGDGAKTVAIPYGSIMKPGMRDARVPLIRARFGLDAPEAGGENDLVYDAQAVAAVAGFQKAHRLPASGILTIRTVAALAGGSDPKRLEDEIVANMERWRWLPRDMGQDRIEVNIPDFTAAVMHGDEVFHQARVVVGQPDKATPVFSDTMRFIIVNPYWNVPLSIVKKEMMPKLAADPNYFANHGYETVERDGQTYVRQPPGDSNALGRIKFMFPNPYSVYLHDTNVRSLFGTERRALSHGCVRVDAPFKFAEAVLGKQNGWTEARVKRLVGGDERVINLPQPLPIHIVYFTAFVDPAGVLQTRDDVYGYSAKLRAALGLNAAARAGQVAVN